MGTPARFGIVDMGSNAVRFLIAEVSSGESATVIEAHRLPVRLGRDVFRTGRIPDATIAATVDACRRFRADCDRHAVTHIRAIATSAMREAHNRRLLADRVLDATGIEIEVISGTQEAYLLKLGVESRMDLSRGRSLLVDLGGGSVEIVIIEDGDVIAADSYRLGALRMLQAFEDAEDTGESFVGLMRRHLESLERRIAARFDGRPIDRYAATGGNIDSITDLAMARKGQQRGDAIDGVTVDEIDVEIASLARMTLTERIDKHGLREDRADTIVPAGIVYAWLGRLAGVDAVSVPRTGIKEGLLAEIARGHLSAFAAADHVDAVLSAARAMGRRFRVEQDHAEAVLFLARRLFDQTAQLHGLDARARVLLDAAALLHDVGVGVSNDGHHKHSQYLIEASALVGLGDAERHLVALVARYHRKAAPSRDHAEFAALRRRDRELVERLAALLRIADALDRQHAGVVRDITVEIRDDRIDLIPALGPDAQTRLFLEARAIQEKGALLANLYGKPIALITPR